MSCTCSFGYEDGYDYSEVWREGLTGATRKPHKCCECGDVIPVGERCCYAVGLSEGQWYTYRRCLSCSALAELVAEINKACPLWGGLEYSAEAAEIDWREWRAKAKAIQ